MWELLMNWYLHTFTQFFIQFPYKKGLNSKLKYWNWLFVIRSLLFEYSNIIQYFKKDQIRIRISLFGLLLFEYSNNELFVATLHYTALCTDSQSQFKWQFDRGLPGLRVTLPYGGVQHDEGEGYQQPITFRRVSQCG